MLRRKCRNRIKKINAFFDAHCNENGMFYSFNLKQYNKMFDDVIALWKKINRLEMEIKGDIHAKS